ncbi:MAG: divergent polysaccharide deacetylase family protein [Deltaproteobacteria bacterium]|nr:divergent polysaccharide deacetylase family protein [Deltaproteobacteria bacterium]
MAYISGCDEKGVVKDRMGNNSKKKKGHLKNSNALIILGAFIGIAAAVLLFNYYSKGKKAPEIKEKEYVPAVTQPEEKPDKVETPAILPEVIERTKPKIAIVIDDMGQNIRQLRELLDMDIPVTIAVLPFLPRSMDVAEEANREGLEILLHIPMEPKDLEGNNPGKGALFTTMSEYEIYEQVLKEIEAVPYIKGVNNHMGSRFTEDEDRMRVVLGAIKEKNLFFLDSNTTAKSKALMIANEIGLNAAQRQVFLDNKQDISYIKGQIDELLRIARKRGRAIAIGHPHPVTFTAIKEMSDKLKNGEIDIVPVSELIMRERNKIKN